MKDYYLLAVFVTLYALFGATSCALTEEQKAKLADNVRKDAEAALVGGLATGTWAGAAAGASAQVIRNHTSDKQPLRKVNP